jgi:hypothetical protein
MRTLVQRPALWWQVGLRASLGVGRRVGLAGRGIRFLFGLLLAVGGLASVVSDVLAGDRGFSRYKNSMPRFSAQQQPSFKFAPKFTPPPPVQPQMQPSRGSSFQQPQAPQAKNFATPQPSAPRTQLQQPQQNGRDGDSDRGPTRAARDDDDDNDGPDRGKGRDLSDADLGDPTAPPDETADGNDTLSDAERKARIERARAEAAREARMRIRDERLARSHKDAIAPAPTSGTVTDRVVRDAERRAKTQDEWNRRDKIDKAQKAAETAAGWETRSVRAPEEGVEPRPDAGVVAGGLEPVKRGRVQWLKGLQRQASKLGVGDGDGEDGSSPSAGQTSSVAGEDATDGTDRDEASDTADAKRGGPLGSKAARVLRRQKDGSGPIRRVAGAEIPLETFIKDRAQELVATGLSVADVDTVKKLGFAATETVVAGAKVPLQRLRAPTGMARDEAERLLHQTLPFLSVTPNYGYSIIVSGEPRAPTNGSSAAGVAAGAVPASLQPCPNDTCFGSRLINWKSTLRTCTKSVRIGVIDTSFDLDHPALRHLKVEQGEFLDGQTPSPYDWHGTAVLSLLAGDPASGTPGLAPDATYLLATAFRSDAAGNASTDTVRLVAALAWLDELDVQFVNMSFSGPQDPAIEQSIERMRKKGVVFVAAAGNMGPTAAPSYPAAYPSVIAVTAINRRGDNYWNANRGNYIDVSAPGVDILTALPNAQQGYRTGTSFAAPFVTAIVASRAGEAAISGPKSRLFSGGAVRDLGPPGRDPIYGSGLALAPSRCAREPNTVAQSDTVARGDAVTRSDDPPASWEAVTLPAAAPAPDGGQAFMKGSAVSFSSSSAAPR